jgi:spore maturation protein CgeB
MGYRFQKFTTTYPAFVSQFLTDTPEYQNLSYRELYARFIKTHYGLSNYYAKELELLGCETDDIFADLEPLQTKWAGEHGVKYSRSNWLNEIVLAQVRDFQPDVLYLQDLYLFDERFRKQLRSACKNRVRLIGWRAAPTEDYGKFRDLDLVLTCVPNFAERLRNNGARVEIVRHAFEPSILNSAKSVGSRDLDFTFTGSLVLQKGFHLERHALMEKLMQATPLQVWGETSEPQQISRARQIAGGFVRRVNRINEAIGVPAKLGQRLKFARKTISQNSASGSALQQRYPNRLHGPVFGVDYYRTLGRSKTTLNNHLDSAGDYAGNMRLFEATGMGACLITDWKVNLAELFEPDIEVLTYRTPEECVEKVNYILEHDAQRDDIAKAGQRRTLRDHTFAQRARQLDEFIRAIL